MAPFCLLTGTQLVLAPFALDFAFPLLDGSSACPVPASSLKKALPDPIVSMDPVVKDAHGTQDFLFRACLSVGNYKWVA